MKETKVVYQEGYGHRGGRISDWLVNEVNSPGDLGYRPRCGARYLDGWLNQ